MKVMLVVLTICLIIGVCGCNSPPRTVSSGDIWNGDIEGNGYGDIELHIIRDTRMGWSHAVDTRSRSNHAELQRMLHDPSIEIIKVNTIYSSSGKWLVTAEVYYRRK